MQKYKYIILAIFLFIIFGISRVNAFVNEAPLFGKVIYVDPGHGGIDPGASYKDIYEKDIVLDLSFALRDELMSRGAIVLMTREGDYELADPYAYMRKRSDLSKRVELINKSMCDAYLSIHLNSYSSSKWQGAQVFYSDTNDLNIVLAESIQKVLKENTYPRREIKEIKNIYLNDNATRPGVIVEAGFISNPNDRYLLRKDWYQKKIARLVTEGVIDFFDNM